LDFQGVGIDIRASLKIKLENVGTAKLTGSVDKSGLAAPFTLTAGSGSFKLAHNQTKVLTIEFAPTSAVESSGSITIKSNDPTNPAVQIGVAGTGVAGTLSVSSTVLNFPPIKVHETSRLKLTIENSGLGLLHGDVDTSNLGKPFSASGGGKFTLATNKSRVVTVTFAPKSSGTFSGAIAITSDGTAPPVPASISVSGMAP